MSTLPSKPTGKRVVEDIGLGSGRDERWQSLPKGVNPNAPAYGYSTIKCELCGSPWGGLVYDRENEFFKHRLPCSLRFG